MSKVREMFEAVKDDFLEFDKIPKDQRLHNLVDLCGMLYLAKKFPKMKGDVIEGAEHDVIYLGGDPNELNEDDVLYLTRCGVMYDSDTEGLSKFV